MIRSMTGYGTGRHRVNSNGFDVEIRTVNHRYLDIYIKPPKQLGFLEEKVRQTISKSISRGRVEVYISYEENGEGSRNVIIDDNLVKTYIDALKTIKEKYDLKDDITVSLISGFPDVFRLEKTEIDEDEMWNLLSPALDEAIGSLVAMREAEGRKIKEDLLEKVRSVDMLIKDVELRSPEVVKEHKQKLEKRLKELLDQKVVDEGRLALEVAIFADRCSIDEELTRLRSHISTMRRIFELGEPVGRRLDFLLQEMNREVNTIGSKASDLFITQKVLDIKGELEKIREQVQNIE